MDYVDKLPTCQWCSFAPPEWRIFTPPLTRIPLWMGKRNNRIFVHGVSFLLGNRRLDHRQDTPPSHHAITKIQL